MRDAISELHGLGDDVAVPSPAIQEPPGDAAKDIIRLLHSTSDAHAAGGLVAELLIEAVPEFGSGVWRLEECRVWRVRKKLRKRIVFCAVSYRDERGRRRTAEIVGKLYGSDRGGAAMSALQRLRDAGFRHPGRLRVTRPYGYSPERGVLLVEHASGSPWAGLLTGDEDALAAASERAAAWLRALHGVRVSGEDGATRPDWSPDRLAAQLGSAFPQSAPGLDRIAGQIGDLLVPEGAPVVPSHGDYHPSNVFLTARHVTVIDLDTFGRREPAFDVGYCMGQLLIMSYLRTGSFARGGGAALSFWRRYEEEGAPKWDRVVGSVGRTLLQSLHYELCTLRNGRVDLLELWPRLIEEWLGSNGPDTLEELSRR